MNNVVVIMAGGLGKRMKSDLPKVLHKVMNKPMLVHVIERALEIKPIKIYIVVGKYLPTTMYILIGLISNARSIT